MLQKLSDIIARRSKRSEDNSRARPLPLPWNRDSRIDHIKHPVIILEKTRKEKP